jgi:cell division protein FtsQ
MAENKRYSFSKILAALVWILLGSGMIVLLVAAITRKNNEPITGMKINITGVQNNYFIDKKDVIKILEHVHGKKLEKAVAASLDLVAMENALQKDQWIKKVEIFLDNNNVLQVNISEREPVARIFTVSGASFYMDSALKRLPLSDKFSARLPVFTDFPTDVMILTKQDSMLLKGIKLMSEYIGNDPFWMAQIEQIDITPSRSFELIPKLGSQVIRFGTADNYKEKFNKLLAFYKQVQTKTGWNRYSVLDLQFKGQIVAVNRDLKAIKADSLRAIQIMKSIIAEAQKQTNDSTHIQLIDQEDNKINVNQSPVIENVPDENENPKVMPEKRIEAGTVTPIHNPGKPVLKNNVPLKTALTKPAIATKKKVIVKKDVAKKNELKKPDQKNEQQPKAVMPPKSDY